MGLSSLNRIVTLSLFITIPFSGMNKSHDLDGVARLLSHQVASVAENGVSQPDGVIRLIASASASPISARGEMSRLPLAQGPRPAVDHGAS